MTVALKNVGNLKLIVRHITVAILLRKLHFVAFKSFLKHCETIYGNDGIWINSFESRLQKKTKKKGFFKFLMDLIDQLKVISFVEIRHLNAVGLIELNWNRNKITFSRRYPLLIEIFSRGPYLINKSNLPLDGWKIWWLWTVLFKYIQIKTDDQTCSIILLVFTRPIKRTTSGIVLMVKGVVLNIG